MSQLKKKCRVMLLPTDKASNIGICIKEMSDVKIGKLGYFSSSMFMSLEYWKPQHLYILSNDEIQYDGFGFHDNVKLGEIMYDKEENRVDKITHIGSPFDFKGTVQLGANKDLHKNRACGFNLRRVTASTNKELRWSDDNDIQIIDYHFAQLPSPSEAFLKEYIESYNSGRVIEEVMVEYKLEGCKDCFKHQGQVLSPDCCGNYTEQLKVKKDNTVVILKIKDSWTREEVIALHKANTERLTNSYTSYDANWIESRL